MKAGDIILVHNSGFVSRGIQFFMNIYRKKLKLPKRTLYNHAVVVVNLWGKLWVADAGAKGIQVRDRLDAYIGRDNVLLLTWRVPLTVEEQELFSKTAINYALGITRYDYKNFIDQIRYIFTGKWKGKTGAKSTKRIYCSEFAAVCMEATRNGTFKSTWDKNPLDIEISTALVKNENS